MGTIRVYSNFPSGPQVRRVMVELTIADERNSAAAVTGIVNDLLGVLPVEKPGPLLDWRFVTPAKDCQRQCQHGIEPAYPHCPKCCGTRVALGRQFVAKSNGTTVQQSEWLCQNPTCKATFWI